eukprot:3672682-Prymnesium_polylepis.1
MQLKFAIDERQGSSCAGGCRAKERGACCLVSGSFVRRLKIPPRIGTVVQWPMADVVAKGGV